MANIIEITDMTLSHGNKKLFENFNLCIEEGSFVTIMGANNTGKSSLVYAICGLLPIQGTIKVNNNLVHYNTNLTNEFIGYVLNETVGVYNTDRVIDELYLNASSKYDVDLIINRLNLKLIIQKNPHHMSVGEQQLLTLAIELLKNPPILIIDNALNMLDLKTKEKVMKTLNLYNKKGMTIINITQNSEDILYGNQVVLINDGQVVFHDTLKKALDNEKTFMNAKIGLPFMAELSTKLKYYGIISKVELNKTRLVSMIWK